MYLVITLPMLIFLLLRGLMIRFYMPYSRHTEISTRILEDIEDLVILAESEEAGCVLLLVRTEARFLLLVIEYDPDTPQSWIWSGYLKGLRDWRCPRRLPSSPRWSKSAAPWVLWRSHANLLFPIGLTIMFILVTPYDLYGVKLF